MTTETLLTLGTPILTPLVVALVKSITDHVPAKWLPCVSMLIGTLADGLAALMTGHQFAPGQGALLGLAGVGIREVIDQLKPKVTVEQVKLAIIGLILFVDNGCASIKYSKQMEGTNVVTKASVRTLLSTSALKGFEIEHTTKTTSNGLSLKEATSDPNTEAIKAIADGLGAVVEKAASGAARGATHL